jgi:hypothetical protein
MQTDGHPPHAEGGSSVMVEANEDAVMTFDDAAALLLCLTGRAACTS